ncbi:MAG: hypothetical protein GY768_08890 [Planctomycetaceae bacterium]|nr:hypothetical protein [Planctomycetaceae bacterium]
MQNLPITWIRRGPLCPLFATALAIGLGSQCYGQFGGMGGRGMGPSPLGNKAEERPSYQTPVIERTNQGKPIVAVKVIGNDALDESRIRTHLQTRVGRDFDPETVQADVRRLSSTGMFRNVRTYRKQVTDGGIEVTFEVFELPIIRHVNFEGNKKVSERALRKACEIAKGESMHQYRVEEAKRKIQETYLKRGFSDADVRIKEGDKPGDQGVTFAIYEGKRQRVFRTRFEGNTIVSDSRLKTQIKSKPGIGWFFKGQVDRDQIDQDQERLTSYYRSLGYFKARVGRYLDFSDSGKWLTLTFVIDEGPRYKIRNVSLVGNRTFTEDSLAGRLEFEPGDFFDARKMNRDLSALRDTYGSQGYIHADIKADPRFLEEAGTLDLVYDIDEGDQYRVGRILVNIDGENPHTRRNVVINRLSLSPNDIIDIREIRSSERRLRSSQLFLSDPAQGIAPSIAIRPPELTEGTQLARQPDRGQDSSY